MASPQKTIETIESKSLWTDILILCLLSFTLRIIDISHLPIDDELFNVIAAHSWAEEGSFKMLDGVYQRAYLFSMSVGYLFRLFGENLVIARIPALVAGIMWILLVFIWVRKYSGRTAAWITALLFCFAPHAIELSQICRFYTLHGLLIWIGATSIFNFMTSNTQLKRKLISCFVAFVCFALALHLQFTTLIILSGIVIWAIIYLTLSFIKQSQGDQRRRIIQFVCILLVVILAIAIINVDFLTGIYTKLQRKTFWHGEEGIIFYHKLFFQQYQILWLFLPFAILIVILRVPQIGFYLTTVFLFSFIIHSTAGWKEERYIYYIVPFLFSIWGIAIQEVLPALRNLYGKCIENITFLSREGHLGNITKWSIVTVGLVLLLFCNGATKRTIHKTLGRSYYFGLCQSDWASAKELLKQLSEGTSVILTTNIPKSIYYLGGFDYAINKNNLAENHEGIEFSIDPRSGRPLFATAKSLQQIINCYPDGLFVGEKMEWRFGTRIDSESAALLEKYAEQIYLPQQWNIITFKWKKPQVTGTDECLKLPGYERIHPNVAKVEDAADSRCQW